MQNDNKDTQNIHKDTQNDHKKMQNDHKNTQNDQKERGAFPCLCPGAHCLIIHPCEQILKVVN